MKSYHLVNSQSNQPTIIQLERNIPQRSNTIIPVSCLNSFILGKKGRKESRFLPSRFKVQIVTPIILNDTLDRAQCIYQNKERIFAIGYKWLTITNLNLELIKEIALFEFQFSDTNYVIQAVVVQQCIFLLTNNQQLIQINYKTNQKQVVQLENITSICTNEQSLIVGTQHSQILFFTNFCTNHQINEFTEWTTIFHQQLDVSSIAHLSYKNDMLVVLGISGRSICINTKENMPIFKANYISLGLQTFITENEFGFIGAPNDIQIFNLEFQQCQSFKSSDNLQCISNYSQTKVGVYPERDFITQDYSSAIDFGQRRVYVQNRTVIQQCHQFGEGETIQFTNQGNVCYITQNQEIHLFDKDPDDSLQLQQLFCVQDNDSICVFAEQGIMLRISLPKLTQKLLEE
ncbi:Hypothetical_protein [Hexamita inflata]|uniref:Hypothetical_protein n=1 Tax=Hexamita inflata TaxID=28002 RepID=A0AA86UND6_9EUKA|nr:Hypothetical protein HINF_LOCUS1827 [Hexamita inflata]CAI9945478.1 Hypothetical protein HINF_LOCUS33123 [Hexamita inflata]